MKKTLCAAAFAAVLTAGALFADHPDGWGAGAQGGRSGNWEPDTDGVWDGALTLKIPGIPIFWGASGGFSSSHFRAGVTGDYYIFDKVLAPSAHLHWFFGAGGYVSYYQFSHEWLGVTDTAFAVGFGARAPLGVSWQPLDFLEVYAGVAASLGVVIREEGKIAYPDGSELLWRKGGLYYPDGGWSFDAGIRFWF